MELRIPLLSEVVLPGEALWGVLADSPVGGVVEGRFSPDDAPLVTGGLRRSGVDPAAVPEIWRPGDRPGAQAPVRPLGVGPTLVVDAGADIRRRDIVLIALKVSSPTVQGFYKE